MLGADVRPAGRALTLSSPPSQVLGRLIEGNDLTLEEAAQSLDLVLESGSSEQVAAFLVLLAAKGVP